MSSFELEFRGNLSVAYAERYPTGLDNAEATKRF